MLVPINTEEVLKELDRRTSGHGNGIKFCEDTNTDYEYMRQIKSGTRSMNQELAKILGFKLMWVKE